MDATTSSCVSCADNSSDIYVFHASDAGRYGGGRGGPMSFGKSKARLISEDQIKTTFADVAGCDEAKDDVAEL